MAEKIQDIIDEFVEGKIMNENIQDLFGDRFARYSKYIIQDRALPDVRDGLKPVQRRILYAMNRLGLSHDKPYKKSARIVGDVIGKYHPHGDSSVYEAMVRLAQDFKMREPLVDMHGNKGSIDGDSAAAMRYTEARMSKLSEYLLQDIDKQTVDYIPNFDDEEYEPIVLPSRFPNLLVNGASGISAGYATEIPPHNLEEVIQGVIKRIDNPSCTIDAILKIVKGPDFPTGAIVQGKKGIRDAFESGRGRIIIKSRVTIENQNIIITEIPYEVNKATLVRRIDENRLKKKVDGIKEVRDESSGEGLRIVIEVKPSFDPEAIVNFLHKKTDLTKSFNYNMVAIDNKRPRTLGILSIFDSYIYHQKEVVTNRSNFELRKAKKRLHIVEGIIAMVDVLDEVIALIRASKSKADAKTRLTETFDFTEEQAEAILTLQLYRLSSTDLGALIKERDALNASIKKLTDILENEKSLEKVIKKELRSLQKDVPSKRRTTIEDEIERIEVAEEDLIESERVRVGLTREGYLRRASLRSHKATENPDMKEADGFLLNQEVSTLDTLLIFTDHGHYIYLPVFKIQDGKWKDMGQHINYIVPLVNGEKVIHAEAVKAFDDEAGWLLFTTEKNVVKRTAIKDFDVQRYNRPIKAMSLKKDDRITDITFASSERREVVTFTEDGFALRYDLEEIPSTSTTAKGVKAMNLKKGETLAASVVLKDQHDIVVLTNRGTLKRLNPEEIEKKKRTLRGERVLKFVKTNPYRITDADLLNAIQYKKRARVHVLTDKGEKTVSAFELKESAGEHGKKFIKGKARPIAMWIEAAIDEEGQIPPFHDFKQKPSVPETQVSLFDDES
ncbi:MAG: DNA topoisomerase IV subunit A [Candidatus Izemoplasmataceae bacterium]